MTLAHHDDIGRPAGKCAASPQKYSQEQSKQCDKEIKTYTWTQNAPDLYLVELLCLTNLEP